MLWIQTPPRYIPVIHLCVDPIVRRIEQLHSCKIQFLCQGKVSKEELGTIKNISEIDGPVVSLGFVPAIGSQIKVEGSKDLP